MSMGGQQAGFDDSKLTDVIDVIVTRERPGQFVQQHATRYARPDNEIIAAVTANVR